jgi:putative redox protein
MISRTASASWEPGPLRCEVAVEGFSILVDEPKSSGGTGLAPQPTDFFLASAASCFMLAMVHTAAKRGIALTALRVDAIGNYAGRRFDAVRLVIAVAGPAPEQLPALIEASERVCYVTNTLRAGARITVSVEPSPLAGDQLSTLGQSALDGVIQAAVPSRARSDREARNSDGPSI